MCLNQYEYLDTSSLAVVRTYLKRENVVASTTLTSIQVSISTCMVIASSRKSVRVLTLISYMLVEQKTKALRDR